VTIERRGSTVAGKVSRYSYLSLYLSTYNGCRYTVDIKGKDVQRQSIAGKRVEDDSDADGTVHS